MKKRIFLIAGLIILIAALVLIFTSSKSIDTKTTFKLKDYQLTDLPISLSIPESTTVKEDQIGDKTEVAFSSYLNDKKLNYWGYIQLWKIEDLEKFLDASKASSVYNFTQYSKEKIQINDHSGFTVKWTARFLDDRTISSEEYFLRKEASNEVLRISFLKDGDNLDDNLQELIKVVINSIKWVD